MKIKIFLIIVFVNLFLCGCLTTEYNLATQKQETYIYSTEKEVSLGTSVARKVEEKFELADRQIQQRIIDIGKRLAQISDRQDIFYHFKVIKDDKPNAIALPGGFIYISDSLVEAADSDDEIAAVLAHEVGHIAARHSVKKIQGSYLYNLMKILGNRLPSDDPYLGQKINYAFGSVIISYIRENELEADRLAVKYVEAAGFDSNAVLTILDKIEELDRKRGLQKFSYFKTHPPVATRKGAVRQAITGCLDFEGYINRAETLPY